MRRRGRSVPYCLDTCLMHLNFGTFSYRGPQFGGIRGGRPGETRRMLKYKLLNYVYTTGARCVTCLERERDSVIVQMFAQRDSSNRRFETSN